MLKQSKKSIPEVGSDYTTLCLQTDTVGIVLSASPAFLLFIGKLQKELLGHSVKKMVDTGDKEKLQALLKTNIQAGTVIQLTLKGKTGTRKIDFTIHKKVSRKIGTVLLWKAALPVGINKPGALPAYKNKWFEKFFRYSNDLLCIGGNDGYFKVVNQSLATLLGYSATELCDKPFIEFVHPDDRQKTLDISLLVYNGQSIKEFENRYCCHNGDVKWLSWSTTFLEKERLILGIGRDVTEKKRAEEELQRKTSDLQKIEQAIEEKNRELQNTHKELKEIIERYEVLVQQSSEIIWRCELHTPIDIYDHEDIQLQQLFEGYLAECNDHMAHFYGYANAAALTGKKVSDFFDAGEPVTNAIVREFIQQGYKLHRRISMHIDHKGSKRYFLNNLVGVVENDKLLRVWTTQNEITQQRLAEKILRESEERFRQFADAAPVMIWVSDENDQTIYVNKCWEEFTGVTINEVATAGWGDLIYPDDKPVAVQKYKSYFAYREPVILEYRMKHKDGHYRWVVDHGVPRFLQDGTFVGYIGSVMDIHDRKQAEEALRINEERYRSVVHALGEGIVIHDKNGAIIACNHSAEAILGVPANMLTGRTASGTDSICIYEDGSPFPPEQHPSLITLGTGRSLQNVVMGIQRKDDALIWISINTEPVYYTEQQAHPDAVVASFVDITQKKAAQIELQCSQQQLKEYSERITNILASITDGFIAVDKNFHIFLWNHAVERITGLKAKNVLGSGIDKVFPNFAETTEYRQYIDAINKGITVSFEHFLPAFNRWLETSVYPFSQGAFIYFRDITERKKQEQLLELEKEVLKINAQAAASLKTTVDYFLEGLEKVFPDMLCSVLMLDDDYTTIHHLSAPSLPVDFTAAIDGIKIGPRVGSCGTAAYRKERVITTDILTDPLWDDFRVLARQCNLQSCWSFPILNAQHDVRATMAVYHRYPQTPTEKDLNILERVNNLLHVIIENKTSETKIRISNERYLLVTKATNDAIWDWDVNTNSLYWGEGIYNLFGYKPGYVDSSLSFWESCIHEADQGRVINGLNEFIRNNHSQIWEEEYRFKKANGEYALVYDRGFLIFDRTGRITRMVGSMQDITEKKEMEKRLLKQELDKQKLIAQAVVNAQEKERAEIGKELHDNVNQILSTAKLYLELAYTDDENRLDLIDRSTGNISDAINEIRNISRSLVPPSIGDLGLIDSIQDLVENVKATRKLHVEFYYEGSVDNLLDEKRKLMLFRIIQEQVNNVLKHASANNLVIELIADCEGHAIDLTISDDGKGFEPEKVRANKGVGLSNIASRAQLFNGSVNIVTASGQGCKLKINVPI